MGNPADRAISEALALRKSHRRAAAADVLDLVIHERGLWLEDFFARMVPPDPFALLVAEAVGDFSPPAEWLALTGPKADERVREAMRHQYAESVLPKFFKRYGWTPPQIADTEPAGQSGWRMMLL
ncbi:MAG: hypothetical protein HS128_10145 [Ideonella sp.]|nr:hypothetical protein [Ideonella sp.]